MLWCFGGTCPKQMTCKLNSNPCGLGSPEDTSKKHYFKASIVVPMVSVFHRASARFFHLTHQRIPMSDVERPRRPRLLLPSCFSRDAEVGWLESFSSHTVLMVPSQPSTPHPTPEKEILLSPFLLLSHLSQCENMILSSQKKESGFPASAYHLCQD